MKKILMCILLVCALCSNITFGNNLPRNSNGLIDMRSGDHVDFYVKIIEKGEVIKDEFIENWTYTAHGNVTRYTDYDNWLEQDIIRDHVTGKNIGREEYIISDRFYSRIPDQPRLKKDNDITKYGRNHADEIHIKIVDIKEAWDRQNKENQTNNRKSSSNSSSNQNDSLSSSNSSTNNQTSNNTNNGNNNYSSANQNIQNLNINMTGMIEGLDAKIPNQKIGRFYAIDGVKLKNTWIFLGDGMYTYLVGEDVIKNIWIGSRYIGSDGIMYRNKQTPDGKWAGDNGLVVDTTVDLQQSMLIEAVKGDSWYKTQSGLWYYFENDRTTIKKNWFIDPRDGQTYYLNPTTGIMTVGLATIDGKQYYFNDLHNNESNWYDTGNGFYESLGKKVKSYGSMFKSEKTPVGLYADDNGVLVNQQTNLTTNDGATNITTGTKVVSRGNTVKVKCVKKTGSDAIGWTKEFNINDFIDGKVDDIEDLTCLLGHSVGETITNSGLGGAWTVTYTILEIMN